MPDHRRSRLLVLAAVAAFTAAATRAQHPWPADRVITDVPVAGEVWAATALWKAGFDARGATFVPFLGSDVPSRPATFALRAARCGGVPLRVGEAEPRLLDQRVTFDRGDVVEYYDLRQHGIEQGFVAARLPNRGALELDVAVATALANDSDAHGHAFVAAEGGVRYGHAVVFDAAGARQPIAVEWTGDVLRLTVPAAFVAAARLPLVVDPLLSPIQSSPTSPKPMSEVDLAYDHSLGSFFACYEHAFSATDHDVYVLRLDTNLQVLGSVTIDYTTAWWARPRIATLEAHDVVRVVAETSTGNVAPYAVMSRAFAGTATVAGAVETYGVAASTNSREPDIGGDADPIGPSKFLVAWSSQWQFNASQLAVQRVAADGAISGPAGIPSGITRVLRPAVSKTCGDAAGGPTGWAIVYRRYVDGAPDGELCLSLIRRDGAILDPAGPYQFFATLGPTTPNAGSEWDVSSPTSHALGHAFLCTEGRVDPGTGRGAIRGHAFDFGGNVLVGDAVLVGGFVDRRRPAVDSDGCRFVVANDSVYSASDRDVRVAAVALVGGQLVVHDEAIVSTALDLDTQPAPCAMRGHGTNDYGLAWIHQANGAWSLQAQRYEGAAAGSGFASRNTGCGNLQAFALGSSALGETFGVGLSSAGGIAGLLVGSPINAPISPCPGCTLGVDGPLLLGAPLVVVTPQEPALVGAVVSFQGVHLPAAGAPCLGQFELSNTIDVTVR